MDQVEKLGLRLGLQHNLIDQFKKDTGDTELLACKLIQCWQENFEGSGDAERQKLDEALRKCNMRSRTYASELLTDEDRGMTYLQSSTRDPVVIPNMYGLVSFPDARLFSWEGNERASGNETRYGWESCFINSLRWLG